MIKWLSAPDATKRNAYEQIAEKTGMSAFAVEKDWWVTQTLSIIFEMDVAQYLVFKGGTSLSKAWNLIERFSEDIDLAIDREFFKFPGELKKSQRTELRKAASKYTSGAFFEEIQKRFIGAGISGVNFRIVDAKDSDQDPRIIELYYPNAIPSPGYLEAKVQIEVGCRSLKEPFTLQEFGSMIDEHYSGMDFSKPFIKVPTVNPERTFLEKIFLLHEEFQRPAEKIRVERLSRHLYDVVKLSKTPFAEKALSDKDLYSVIVEHRHKFTRLGGVDYNLHQPESINPIPLPALLKDWKNDYETMLEEMIYESNPPSFDEIIEELKILKSKINSLGWRFDKEF
jgi:predicted nucleotidyltransferase component of viral defense system